MTAPSEPFRFLMRVRYGECDAQGIVFNARYGDFVDVAVTEFTRAIFGGVDVETTGMDWQLVKQTLEWHAPSRYDDVLDCRIATQRVGTTSFVVATEFRRFADGTRIAIAETVYVSVKAGKKLAVSDAQREQLLRGAPGVVVDHAAALR